jgi:uncharacterized protein
MTGVTSATSTQELSVPACWSLLRSTPVGRLATILDGRPDIHPVNFVVDHGSVVFRTAEGSKLRGAAGHDVAFEVDGYDAADGVAWSVVVKGTAREVHDLDETITVMLLPLFPWQDGLKPRFVRIEPELVTGRRFAVRGGHVTTVSR